MLDVCKSIDFSAMMIIDDVGDRFHFPDVALPELSGSSAIDVNRSLVLRLAGHELASGRLCNSMNITTIQTACNLRHVEREPHLELILTIDVQQP